MRSSVTFQTPAAFGKIKKKVALSRNTRLFNTTRNRLDHKHRTRKYLRDVPKRDQISQYRDCRDNARAAVNTPVNSPVFIRKTRNLRGVPPFVRRFQSQLKIFTFEKTNIHVHLYAQHRYQRALDFTSCVCVFFCVTSLSKNRAPLRARPHTHTYVGTRLCRGFILRCGRLIFVARVHT